MLEDLSDEFEANPELYGVAETYLKSVGTDILALGACKENEI